MNKKTPRQLITLKEWHSHSPKKTDPHYSGRLLFDRHLLTYITQCLDAEESPEFFVSLWVNEDDGKAALGIAVPVEWVNHVNRASREDYPQWMD
jgi:hypothetical protein